MRCCFLARGLFGWYGFSGLRLFSHPGNGRFGLKLLRRGFSLFFDFWRGPGNSGFSGHGFTRPVRLLLISRRFFRDSGQLFARLFLRSHFRRRCLADDIFPGLRRLILILIRQLLRSRLGIRLGLRLCNRWRRRCCHRWRR